MSQHIFKYYISTHVGLLGLWENRWAEVGRVIFCFDIPTIQKRNCEKYYLINTFGWRFAASWDLYPPEKKIIVTNGPQKLWIFSNAKKVDKWTIGQWCLPLVF